MDAAAFTNPSGELVTQRPLGGGRYLTFVPDPLPPPPAIEQAAIASAGALLADAEYWLGQLIGRPQLPERGHADVDRRPRRIRGGA